ncbi:MAG: metalloregulator ArsR/SmtB family transcription factor [Gammaproteobacteria bacterium]|nr:metalloregulator ArsR/SmtB family transcription factor [Gammaproteobacteria bacterium]
MASVEALLKASADGLRLHILQVLQHDSYGVLELCNLFAIKQSAMSHHLKVLAQAGLVTTRREGNAIFYRRALPAATANQALVNQLFASIDAQPFESKVQQAVDRAQLHRSECSLKFFAEHSEEFKAQQDLIAPIDEYRDALNELLDTLLNLPQQPLASKQAVEIGPGEGTYLADLASRFEHVIALDNAESMLERCRRAATRKNLGNIGFIHGTTTDLLDLTQQLNSGGAVSARKANCIVANMVLHHNARPQLIFNEASQLLAGSGVFIVSELCQHDQGWVREAAGDVWLGFQEAQLNQWAEAAKLQRIAGSYTALRNGFRIQIHAYGKDSPREGD